MSIYCFFSTQNDLQATTCDSFYNGSYALLSSASKLSSALGLKSLSSVAQILSLIQIAGLLIDDCICNSDIHLSYFSLYSC